MCDNGGWGRSTRKGFGPLTRHLVIPDTQIKPSHDLAFIRRIGQAAVKYKPDVIIQGGDWYDMHSLSSYDRGKKAHEGARFEDDIRAGNEAWAILNSVIDGEINRQKRNKKKAWNPRRVYLLGNHEARIPRYVNDFPYLEGTLSYDRFVHPGWERHGFLKKVWIDGFCYSHYFPNALSGRPIGGTAENRLSKLGCSFFAFHEQQMKVGVREVPSGRQWGFVCGSCYEHDESYRLGSNGEKRGIFVLNEVENGDCDPMFVSLNYLRRKFP